MPKVGIKIPKMGAPAGNMADALFTQTKQRVLGLLFGQPERAFGTNELIKLAESGSGSVQRELTRLVEAGLVRADGKRYQANAQSPIFEELRGIVDKTSGIPRVLRDALAPLADTIDLAILYGSVAKHTDTAASDIDVLVVSNSVVLEDLFKVLQPAEAHLGRRVNPSLYSLDDFRERIKTKHPFLSKVMQGKHTVLVGREGRAEPRESL